MPKEATFLSTLKSSSEIADLVKSSAPGFLGPGPDMEQCSGRASSFSGLAETLAVGELNDDDEQEAFKKLNSTLLSALECFCAGEVPEEDSDE